MELIGINHSNSTKKKKRGEENCGFGVENGVILEYVMPYVFKNEWGDESFQINFLAILKNL